MYWWCYSLGLIDVFCARFTIDWCILCTCVELAVVFQVCMSLGFFFFFNLSAAQVDTMMMMVKSVRGKNFIVRLKITLKLENFLLAHIALSGEITINTTLNNKLHKITVSIHCILALPGILSLIHI